MSSPGNRVIDAMVSACRQPAASAPPECEGCGATGVPLVPTHHAGLTCRDGCKLAPSSEAKMPAMMPVAMGSGELQHVPLESLRVWLATQGLAIVPLADAVTPEERATLKVIRDKIEYWKAEPYARGFPPAIEVLRDIESELARRAAKGGKA